jgi:hypothetical protein
LWKLLVLRYYSLALAAIAHLNLHLLLLLLLQAKQRQQLVSQHQLRVAYKHKPRVDQVNGAKEILQLLPFTQCRVLNKSGSKMQWVRPQQPLHLMLEQKKYHEM